MIVRAAWFSESLGAGFDKSLDWKLKAGSQLDRESVGNDCETWKRF
jgi:hypothetical protein